MQCYGKCFHFFGHSAEGHLMAKCGHFWPKIISLEIIVWINKSQTQLHKGFHLNVKNTIEKEQDTYHKSQLIQD